MKTFAALAAGSFLLAAALPAAAQMGPPQPLPAEALVDQADPATVAFLRDRIVATGPVTGGLAFDFPDDFYESRLILLGESHGMAAPQLLDIELLAHLNARIGLIDYIAEVDPVQGDRLNAYLETGDEAILDRVFDYWTESGAQWGNTAFEDKVRAIRTLNQTLPQERRIRIIGVDAIQDWALLRDWVVEQGGVLDAADWEGAVGARERAALALGQLDGLPAGDSPVRARLANLLQRTASGTDRETAIFDTYASAVRSGELGDRPAYGLWGFFHVMQGEVGQETPFAARVAASDLPGADRVTSLVVLSLDSAVQIPAPLPTGLQRLRLTDFNIDGPFVKVQGSSTLRDASEAGRLVVFDIAGEDTPVRPGDFITIRTSVGQDFTPDPARPTARYARYVGVFRDSDWAPPREE